MMKDIIKPLTLIDYFSIEHEDIHKLYDRNRIRNNYLKIDNHTSREKISILFDGMWKAMIYNTNRLKYSCKLLSYYLNIPYGELLKSLSLGKNELDKRNINNKRQRADYIANYKNICINIEINNNDNEEIMKRNREYRHRLQSQKVKVGDDYDYADVLQLHINNFAFEGKEDIKYIHYLKDKDGDLECDNEIVAHIYVPNLYKKWYTSGIESLTEEERFLLVMIEPDVEKAKLLAKGDKIMEEYVEESLKVSQDDDLLEAYDKEWAY